MLLFFNSGLPVCLLFASLVLSAGVLVDFQVAQPPPLPQDANQCTVELFQHTFGNSYGAPEIFEFTPPTDCGPVGSWAGISLNLTGTSSGTQYDRLAILTFQNVEIWRTSTPEPTTDGIIWTYIKDVTRYIPLFATPGTLVLELDNVVDAQAGYDGEYTTTLSATFFESSADHPPAPKADVIIPLSTLANNTSDDASVPPIFSLNVTVPQNTVEIYAELYASGNGDEEFWYFNVPTELLDDFPEEGYTWGGGPFREVRLLVDGQVAGVALPYAVIFSGGILPAAWRPITSYGALDLPTYFIDLTPFVPVLTDGNAHNISIDVVSVESDHSINQNWYVSGVLQIKTDPSNLPTTGNITKYEVEPFATGNTTSSSNRLLGQLNITVTASQSVHIQSEIISGSGNITNVVWTQNFEYSNFQRYRQNENDRDVFQTASGTFLSTHNGVTTLQDDFSYPLNINITAQGEDSFRAFFDHSYNRTSLPSPFILGSTILERQRAAAVFFETIEGNFGFGTNNNTFTYTDTAGNTYDREVNAVLNNITLDHQGGSLAPSSEVRYSGFNSTTSTAFAKPRFPGGGYPGQN